MSYRALKRITNIIYIRIRNARYLETKWLTCDRNAATPRKMGGWRRRRKRPKNRQWHPRPEIEILSGNMFWRILSPFPRVSNCWPRQLADYKQLAITKSVLNKRRVWLLFLQRGSLIDEIISLSVRINWFEKITGQTLRFQLNSCQWINLDNILDFWIFEKKTLKNCPNHSPVDSRLPVRVSVLINFVDHEDSQNAFILPVYFLITKESHDSSGLIDHSKDFHDFITKLSIFFGSDFASKRSIFSIPFAKHAQNVFLSW